MATDWGDPITYTAIAGAVTGLTGSVLSILQWLDRRRQARERREAEERPLEIQIERWNAQVTGEVPNASVLVEVALQITNPASLDNAVQEATLEVKASGKVSHWPALKPQRRSNQGPWVLERTRVREDVLAVPINVSAHQGTRGSLYFALPSMPGSSTLEAYRDELSDLRLCVRPLRGSQLTIDIPVGP